MADDNVLVESSILTTIKKLLGLTKEYTAFDLDVITHINTVFGILTQMGIGPLEGFMIQGYGETWDQYMEGDNPTVMQQIKTLIYQKVKFFFDPPSNPNLSNAISKSIAELEYRIYSEKGGY